VKQNVVACLGTLLSLPEGEKEMDDKDKRPLILGSPGLLNI
jgi:hypothetical protein